MHPLRPPPSVFSPFKGLYSWYVVFLVEQQHYLSVAVPSMRASVLISFFFLRRGTSLPLPFSFPFLSYANELHRGNELLGKRGWGGSGRLRRRGAAAHFGFSSTAISRIQSDLKGRRDEKEVNLPRSGPASVRFAIFRIVLSQFLDA